MSNFSKLTLAKQGIGGTHINAIVCEWVFGSYKNGRNREFKKKIFTICCESHIKSQT